MNLVEISEMLKGAPDTYLTQHIQSPDGSVPQYLALAELQRRQDMRARFAQQSPQTTVADDATQGIAAAAPGMMPPAPPMGPQGAPPMAPPGAGFAEGGEVADKSAMKDTVLDQILRRLGIRNLPSERVAYEGGIRQAQRRLAGTVSNADQRMQQHARRMQQGMQLQEEKKREQVRNAMLDNPLDAIQAERERYSLASPAERMAMDKAQQEAFNKEQDDWLRQRMIDYPEEFKLGPGPSSKTSPRPPGYKEGGLIEQYIKNAGRFESGNNRNAKNPFSSASGRFQFIDSTRRRLDKKYGFDPKDRSDKTERARMDAYTNETIQALESANIPVTGGTLYGGHFLGQKGIADFFAAYQKDPNTKVEDFFSAEIIRKNPAIFNPKKAAPRRTLSQVMEKFDQVGGSKVRTPITGEDMNLAAATQVAKRADRGDVGAYEDMNMGSAMALAKDLERNKGGKTQSSRQVASAPDTKSPSNMALLQLLSGAKKSSPAAQPSFFYTPAENSIDQQIRAQLLEPYAMPQAGSGIQGFYEGGLVPYTELYGPDGEPIDLTFKTEKMRKEAEKKRLEKLAEQYGPPAEAAKRTIGGLAAFIKNPMNAEGYLPTPIMGGINYAKELATDPLGPVQTARRNAQWAMPEATKRVAQQIEEVTGKPGAPLFTDTGQLNVVPPKPPEAPKEDPYDVIARQFLDDLKKNQMSKEEMRQNALLQAGLGMMAGESPYFATNVGRGAMAGLQSYQQSQAQNREMSDQAIGNMMKARALGLDARRVQSAEDTAKAQAEYQRSMIDYNKARAQAFLERAKLGGGVSREQEITYRAAVQKLLESEGVTGQITEERFNQILDMVRRGLMNYGIKGSPDMGDFEEGPNVSDTAE